MKAKEFRNMINGEILVISKLTGLNRMSKIPHIGDQYTFQRFNLLDPFSASYVSLTDKYGETLSFSPSIAKNLELLQNYRNKRLHLLLEK